MGEIWDIVDRKGKPTGRYHERGTPMKAGDLHLAVRVWIRNARGEFLISRRHPEKRAGGMWETTTGSALAGEDGKAAALREAREELGIALDPAVGRLIGIDIVPHEERDGAAYTETWLFPAEVALTDIRLQEEETVDAVWATPDDIRRLLDAGRFVRGERTMEVLGGQI